MPTLPTIAIVGAGAIGCYYGGRLAQHNFPVHFLLRSDHPHISRHGLTVKSVAGDFHLHPSQLHIHVDPNQMPQVDLIIVTLKSTVSDQYESLINPLLKSETAILTLQNGLGTEEAMAARFGPQRILGGLAWICCARSSPGQINHTFGGAIQLSDFTAGPGLRAERVAKLFNESKVEAEVLDDIRTGKWRKLAWNVAFSGLGALLGLPTDRLLDNDSGVQYVSALMTEVIAIAQALKIPIPPDFVEKATPFTRKMGSYRTSMQLDREQGRPMELEAIFAGPLRHARQLGVSAPRLTALYDLLSLLNLPVPALHAPEPPR